MSVFNYVFHGPCGGPGGNTHDPWVIPEDAVVTGFEVFNGDYINRIELSYVSPSVAPHGATQTYGGTDSGKSPGPITLSTSPAEYITEIAGKYDSNPDNKGKVFFVAVTTNLRTYTYGNDQSGWPSFAVPVPAPPEGGLAGLWGDAGSVCDTVGVVTRYAKAAAASR